MSIAATVNWEVRSTGSDSNGGGFDPVSGVPGTDYSQQNTAQVAYTDLVIGATTTQLTSAGNPFAAADVGNIINITGGTGFTVGRYQVMSVSSAVATMDRAVGTASSTAGTGNLGGGLLTLNTAFNAGVVGNTWWLQNGTYGAATAPSAAAGTLAGYTTTHGDSGGTRPTITVSTNVPALTTSNNFQIQNIIITQTGTKANAGVNVEGGGSWLSLYNVLITGFSVGVASSNSWSYAAYLNIFSEVEISGCATGILADNRVMMIGGNYIHGNTTAGVNVVGSGADCWFDRTIFYDNAIGLELPTSASAFIRNCAFVSNTGDAIYGPSGLDGLVVENNIFYGNTGYGINLTTIAPKAIDVRFNGFGSNTAGNYTSYVTPVSGSVALTANPFTASGSGNFSLNSTAGGGAALKAAGYPGVFGGGLTTGSLDIGPAQSGAPGGSSSAGGSYVFLS